MNMNVKKILTTLFSAVVILEASTITFACACCADRGQYWVYTNSPDAYTLGLLRDMRMESGVELFLTDSEDDTKGIGKLGWEDLSLVDAFANNTWTITIKSATGKSGTLILPRPARMTIKKIDIHDKDEGDPVVYIEFVFYGIVRSGGGEFRNGIVRPTTYTLIFQGRGNNCDNAEDFTHWRLQVAGAKAAYAFYGKMKKTGE